MGEALWERVEAYKGGWTTAGGRVGFAGGGLI